eukprot:9385409-Pyramimonas_sp.AAC.1
MASKIPNATARGPQQASEAPQAPGSLENAPQLQGAPKAPQQKWIQRRTNQQEFTRTQHDAH